MMSIPFGRTPSLRRTLPALLVLFVLGTSQILYAADAMAMPSGHCAAMPAPADVPCRLPLWLTCCDQQLAVQAGPSAPLVGFALALPLAPALAPEPRSFVIGVAAEPRLPPGSPNRLSVVLQI
jgi:hypothetical protein